MEKKNTEKTETSKKVKPKSKKLSKEEYKKLVHELADKGLTAEKIGEKLRQQGIHPKEYKEKISKILGDKYINPDIKNLEEKLERIKKHYENNKQDKRAKREKDRVFAQLRRLKLYFKIPIKKKK